MSVPIAEDPSNEPAEEMGVESARLAAIEDLPAVVLLAELSRSEMREKRGGEVLGRLDPHSQFLERRFDSALRDELTVLAVGTIDDVPIGYGLLTLKLVSDTSIHGVIEELFVDPEARSVGVGEALVDLLLEIARRRGALGIDALALPGDRHTKNFFETQGMVARAIIVHRRIDQL